MDPRDITKQASDDALSQILPAIGGAINAVGFGAPEALLRHVEAGMKNVPQETINKAYDAWKAKNAGYGAGEMAGTVGSMFIPGGAFLKGAGMAAKALGAGRTGTKLAELGATAAGKVGVKQGALVAAEQALPRAGAEFYDTGDFGDSVGNTALGIGIGAGAGKLMSGGGKLVEAFKKRQANRPIEEIEEGFIDHEIANILGKKAGYALRQVVGKQQGPMGQIETAENIKGKLIDLTDKYGLKNSQKLEDWAGDQSDAWNELGSGMNAAIQSGKAQPLAVNVMKSQMVPSKLVDARGNPIMVKGKPVKTVQVDPELYNDPQIQYLVKYYGEDVVNGKIAKLGRVIADTADDPANSFVITRRSLTKSMDDAFMGRDTEQVIEGDVAGAMKTYFDQKAMQFAPEGSPKVEFLKEWYPVALVIGKAIAKDKMSPSVAFTPGSDTFTRFMIDASAGDPAKIITGGIMGAAGQALNKVASEAGNLVYSEGGGAIRKAWPRTAEGAPKELPEIGADIAKASPLMGKLGEFAGAGAKLTPYAVEKSGMLGGYPNNDKQSGDATQVGGPMQPQSTNEQAHGVLDAAIENVWQNTENRHLMESQIPGYGDELKREIKRRVIDSDGNINYLRASKILFPDPAQEKEFRDAYTLYSTIKKSMPSATSQFGTGSLPYTTPTDAEIQKQVMKSKLADYLSKSGGLDGKSAENLVDRIIGQAYLETDPSKKSRAIINLLKTAVPSAFGPGGYLDQVGVQF
jgi:hypothetical protein